jgi:hypothetical protein
MITEFKLNKKEQELAKEFEHKHRHPGVNKGAIGGHINYIFTPTPIGDAITIECDICGETQNITDYDNW